MKRKALFGAAFAAGTPIFRGRKTVSVKRNSGERVPRCLLIICRAATIQKSVTAIHKVSV